MLNEKLNFIDLFCGAGGLSTGLEMAGLNCLFGNDSNKNAIATFKKNHPHAEAYGGSIANIDREFLIEKLKNNHVHLIVGGPPCQGFSTIGCGNPEDERNALFNHYCRIVNMVKPEFIIFENVTGLLARKNEFIFDAILNRFSHLGYQVTAKVLEAQHFGVPQKRKRTILFGTRLKKKLDFPKPQFDCEIEGRFKPSRTLQDALNIVNNFDGKILNHDLKNAEIKKQIDLDRIKCIPEGRGIRYEKDELELLPNELRLNVDWKNMKENRLRELHYFRLDRNKPSPTLNTQNHHYYHPFENRSFTIRELATIQSFPMNYEFEGKYAGQLKQIGNAVPPLLACALGKKIIEVYHSMDLDLSSEQNEEVSLNVIRKEAFNYDGMKAIMNYHKRDKVTPSSRSL